MTLEELDNILTKVFGFDLNYEECRNVRDVILETHGRSLLEERSQRCSKCWFKEHGGCSNLCPIYGKPDSPIEASKEYLSKPNDISVFPFVCLFVVPVYENVSGRTGVMEEFNKRYKELLRRKLKK